MTKTDLTSELGIVGGLYDIFNAMAADCVVPEASALFKTMAGRFNILARFALAGSFGYVGDKRATLQDALDHVFQPMEEMYKLTGGNPVTKAVWTDACGLFKSLEDPVVDALIKCAMAAPDATPVPVMRPIKFRFRAQPAAYA